MRPTPALTLQLKRRSFGAYAGTCNCHWSVASALDLEQWWTGAAIELRRILTRAQKTRDVLNHLRSIGWVHLQDGQGSHELWGLPDGSKKAVVPAGHREVSAGVLRQIQKAGAELPESWK